VLGDLAADHLDATAVIVPIGHGASSGLPSTVTLVLVKSDLPDRANRWHEGQ